MPPADPRAPCVSSTLMLKNNNIGRMVVVQDWMTQLVTLFVGLTGGATIGSLVTVKIVRSTTTSKNSRVVKQSNITAGRDNIGGDRTDRL